MLYTYKKPQKRCEIFAATPEEFLRELIQGSNTYGINALDEKQPREISVLKPKVVAVEG